MSRISRALLALALLAGHASAKEGAFLTLSTFAEKATTGSVVFTFESPGRGIARVELAIPADGRKARKERKTFHVGPGHARLEFPVKEPAAPVEFDVQVEFPRWSLSGKLGTFGRGEGQFVRPTHVAISSRGELYVVDTGNDRIQVFDKHLDFLFQFGTFNPSPAAAGAEIENARFDEPWDAVINGYQELFVTDRNNRRVVRFDLLGRVISEFGRDLGLAIPRGLASDLDRELYVCDSDNDRILVLHRDGRLRRRIGAFGWGVRQFRTPTDVAVSPERDVYVADSGNRRVCVFDRFDRPLGTIEGPFRSPENLYLDADGFLYVIDSGGNRIYRYDSRREEVGTFPAAGDDYTLDTPTDCARAPDGTLYIVDSGHSQILVLDEKHDVYRKSGTVAPP